MAKPRKSAVRTASCKGQAEGLISCSFADRLRALREKQYRNVKVTAPKRKKPTT